MPNLIGTAPDQVPTNGLLGNMAFQNKEGVVTDLLSTTALTVTGNVGIGTASPNNKLQVNGANVGIRISDTSGTTDFHEIQSGGVNGQNLFIDADRNNLSGNMIFRVAGATERMRITSAGNVGIGTSSPSTLLTAKLDQNATTTIRVENASTGVSAAASLAAASDVSSFEVYNFGSGRITDGTNQYNNGASSVVNYNGAKGLILAACNSAATGSDGISFWTANAGNAVKRMTLDASGNVGIANTTPRGLLHIGTSASATDIPVPAGNFAIVRGGGYNGATTAGIQLSGGYGDAGRVAAWQIKSVGSGSGSNFVNDLLFTTQNGFSGSENERMRITAAGNVGIGTTTTSFRLDVRSAGTYTGDLQAALYDTRAMAANVGGGIGFGGNYTGTTVTTWASISGLKENATDGNFAGCLAFYTRPNGSGSIERMRLASNGDVSIGTSSALGGKLNVFGGYVLVQGGAGSAQGALGSTSTTVDLEAVGANAVRVNTNGAERMRIDSSGNVAIGSTATAAKLNVVQGASGTYGSAGIWVSDNATTSMLMNTISSGVSGMWSSGVLAFGSGSNNFAERMRIDASGNLLVGTTSSSGSASNTARVIGGVFSTLRSSASVANNTATTIATLPAGEGNYMVSASLSGSSVPADYNEVAMVRISETNSSITILVNAAQLSLSMSGLNLQVTHLQGLTQTIQYSVLRIL